MKNKPNICIIGGYDGISKALFSNLKKKKLPVIFINLNENKIEQNNLYNFKVFQLNKILTRLRYDAVNHIVFLGKIRRPNLSEFENDDVIVRYLPQVFEAYKKGDGEILKLVVKIFKENNFKISPARKFTNEFLIENEIIHYKKYKKELIDINKSNSLLNSLSKYDNAQSAVCVNGYVLAIEAAEGTDGLLKRVYSIRKNLNQLKSKAGFLTKIPKKYQSKLIDLPVIGPTTIKLLKKANLEGLAIDRENTMIYKKNLVLKLIKEFDLKIFNVT